MSLLLLLASVAAASLPMIAFLIAIWWLDRYEREPPLLVLATFGWGAMGAVIFGVIGSVILRLPVDLLAPKAASLAGPVLIAPLVEEPAKALIFLLLLRTKHVDGMTDGFVYGAAAGLGFGMTENFLYFTKPALAGAAGPWLALVIMRTFFSAVMHAMATSLVGASLGWARFRGPRAIALATVGGLAMAMAVHALWNGLITFDKVLATGGKLALLDSALFVLEFVVIFGLFQLCILAESATIRRHLLHEASLGTMSEQTARTLSSWHGRSFRRWAPPHVNQAAYTELAMTLALRKQQAQLLARRPGDRPLDHRTRQLEAQILGLRADLHALWRPQAGAPIAAAPSNWRHS